MKKREISVVIILLFFGLAVSPSIYADNKMSLDPIADLDCEGEIDWYEVEPGSTISGTCITVYNVGDDDSLLNWEIQSYPNWGNWTFDPDSGTGLLAGDSCDIFIEIEIPEDVEEDLFGEVVLFNQDDSNDTCIVYVFIRIKAVSKSTPIQLVFLLINKLRYYEGIESEEDVMDIIESDAELDAIYEKLASYGCDCEDNSIELWNFPIICSLLYPIIMLLLITSDAFDLGFFLLGFLGFIGAILNCYWNWWPE